MTSSGSLIAGLVVALLVACHEPAGREPTSDQEFVPDPSSVATPPSHENETAQDPQSLVGRNWNTVRPTHCRGETLLRGTEPLHTYVIPTWKGRTLFVYRAGGPLFEIMNTENDRQVDAQRRRANLEILGVVDLGAFDWQTRVISGAVFDNVVCWDPRDGGPNDSGLVVGVVELSRASYEAFPPERAWKWNDQEGSFETIGDPSRVSCWFQEVGDTILEEWWESWSSYGWPNYQCAIE